MQTITLLEALSLIAGRPRETAMVAFVRLVRDQNELRQLMRACIDELERSARYRWLLRSFTLEHVTNVGPGRRPLPKSWPPEAIIACLAGRKRQDWPPCVDGVKARAEKMLGEWEQYRADHSAALEQLTLAACSGSLRLYYRDAGTSGLILVPSALLQAAMTIRPFEETLLVLTPAGGRRACPGTRTDRRRTDRAEASPAPGG